MADENGSMDPSARGAWRLSAASVGDILTASINRRAARSHLRHFIWPRPDWQCGQLLVDFVRDGINLAAGEPKGS